MSPSKYLLNAKQEKLQLNKSLKDHYKPLFWLILIQFEPGFIKTISELFQHQHCHKVFDVKNSKLSIAAYNCDYLVASFQSTFLPTRLFTAHFHSDYPAI